MPTVDPNTLMVTLVSPPAKAVGALLKSASLTAMVPNRISRKPMVPAVASACRTALGAFRRGSSVSSASEPALSKPYITYSGMMAPTSRAPR